MGLFADERNTEKCGLGIHGGLVAQAFTTVAWLHSLVREPRSQELCGLAKKKKKAKCGFLRIVIVPGIGLGCLSFSCIGGSKDRIAAVCVILQILNACCPHELKKYEETLDAVSEELPS